MVLKIATRGSSTGTLPKVATGILGFDASTGGGLPAAWPSLVRGAAGCSKPQLDEPGVFMSSGKRAENLAANIASLGPDLDGPAASGRLAIDHVRVERSEIEGTGDDDLERLFVRLGCTTGVVLDAIATLFSGFGNPALATPRNTVAPSTAPTNVRF
jgi:circadian clock protein KaiC